MREKKGKEGSRKRVNKHEQNSSQISTHQGFCVSFSLLK